MTARRIRFGLILPLCLAAMACAAWGSYGRIDPSAEATGAFEEGRIDPAYRYYISGPDLNPNALLALHRSYRIDPATLWRETAMSEERMREFVAGMRAKAATRMDTLQGFALTDPAGRSIGFWYSILRARTSLRINADGTVRIDTPPLMVYEEEEGMPLRSRILGPRGRSAP